MGIQGLLQFIKDASEPIHVRKYKGQVVAVDTYCWLHKGAVACAEKLAKGEPTDKYVGFCMKFVNMLLSHGIKPILVFDGCTLPSKKEVEKSRREQHLLGLCILTTGPIDNIMTDGEKHEVVSNFVLVGSIINTMYLGEVSNSSLSQYYVSFDFFTAGATGVDYEAKRRQANLLKGKQLLREGKVSEARECFVRAINITHAMAHKVIKAARSQGVDCLVAPYEADAQLAFLNKAGIVQAIITEDSDLLAFGCKKVILKMDQVGNGLEIDQSRLGMCRQLGDVFTEEKFRYMCILSGCDYLSSLRGIGLAKACKLLRLANNPDIVKVIKKIGHYLKMNITVPEDYIKGFIRANNTFLYQLVFDPITRKLTPLNAYEDDIDPATLSYAGCYVDDSVALQIALGNKDINTFEQIDDYSPDTAMPVQTRSQSWNDKACQKSSNMNSIWHRNYYPRHELDAVPKATPVKDKLSTTGIEQVISIKRLNLPKKSLIVKRPRSEELSEDDLLSQYSFSCSKKTRKENLDSSKSLDPWGRHMPNLARGTAGKQSLSTPPRTRNKFATLLQRKNEEQGAVVVPGTRSSSLDSANCMSKKDSSQPLDSAEYIAKKESSEDNSEPLDESAVTEEKTSQKEPDCLHGKTLVDSDIPRNSSDPTMDDVTVFANETSKPLKTSRFTGTISPPTLGTLRSCFSWSGSLGDFARTPSPSPSMALQQFRQERDLPSSPVQKNEMSEGSLSNSDEVEGKCHPLFELRGSSQSQGSVELSPHYSDAANLSQPSSKDSDSEGSDSAFKSLDNRDRRNAKLSYFSKEDKLLKNKVPGLYKSSSVDSLSTTKIKPLVPAKVSGLSKKPVSIQRRNHHNAENKPGLQIKINELWKNFGYKKDSEKLSSCKKPLSPVKNNIQLTPEADDDVFNKSECTRVQRAIFQ